MKNFAKGPLMRKIAVRTKNKERINMFLKRKRHKIKENQLGLQNQTVASHNNNNDIHVKIHNLQSLYCRSAGN